MVTRSRIVAIQPGKVVIYHNPKCSTSRKVLGMLHEAGVKPRVVEYLRVCPGTFLGAA